MKQPIAFATILGLLAGCASPDPFAGKDYLNCRSASTIEALPTLRATVKRIDPCGVVLKTKDGKALTLAGPLGGEPVVERFMKTLEHGRTYTFPSAFTDFKKREDTPHKAMERTSE